MRHLPCLKPLRIARRLTQRGIAAAAGITASAYNALEQQHARARIDTQHKLAAALNVPVDWLWAAPPAAAAP